LISSGSAQISPGSIELPPPARKTIDLEGRVPKDTVKESLRDRQNALSELVAAVRLYRKLADSKPLTLQENDYTNTRKPSNGSTAQSIEGLNWAE